MFYKFLKLPRHLTTYPVFVFILQHEQGFKKLSGVDYSQAAIELAQNVAKEKEVEITYQV